MCEGKDPNRHHTAPGSPVDHTPPTPEDDPFHPPSIPTMVFCLHCGEEYDSWQIEWREGTDAEGRPWGFWCCPTPECGGAGFGFDIHPIDPDYVDPDGRDMGEWVDDPPPDPETDPDRPPKQPTPVRCQRCGREYSSDQMVWWVDEDCPEDAFQMGGWLCPTPECDGMGFGLDVRPTDPNFEDPDGRRILRPGEKFDQNLGRSFDEGPDHEDDIPF